MNLHDWDLTQRAEEAGREKGLAEGARNNAIENAKNMLKEKIAPEVVVRCTGLSLEEVQKLAEDIE